MVVVFHGSSPLVASVFSVKKEARLYFAEIEG